MKTEKEPKQPCACGEPKCTGVSDGAYHQCGGPGEACSIAGCRECGAETSMDNDNEEIEFVAAGFRPPFVQVGMIVHPDDCPHCDGRGNQKWCSLIVRDIIDYDDNEMMAILFLRAEMAARVLCQTVRSKYRLVKDFDATKVYTGYWRMDTAEVEEDA